MSSTETGGDEPSSGHPYLTGNFAPIQRCLPLTPCSFEGVIPPDLAGGQYVRNGGNPLANADLGREAHWFDGDGMLSGVLFRRTGPLEEDSTLKDTTTIRPEFVNQYMRTDLYLYASGNKFLRIPVLPSISTLVSPATSLLRMVLVVLRAVFLVFLSRLPGALSIKKISVANTSVFFHDGRALATCESGPPLRFSLPDLNTVGWYDGIRAENEPLEMSQVEASQITESERKSSVGTQCSGFGGTGSLHWMREWTTAHPRVDPETGELISFHSMFVSPYVRYSVVQPRNHRKSRSQQSKKAAWQIRSTFDIPVPGVTRPKMMHDFGVSSGHTIILDLPLVLDPLNPIVRGIPSLNYDGTLRSRFGVFPRYRPDLVRWFETNACVIFHTANCWDTRETHKEVHPGVFTVNLVNLLACRLTSASVIFSAGNLPTPIFTSPSPDYSEEEQCRLYYYAFDLDTPANVRPLIRYQWALSTLSFEFPTVSPLTQMREARYVYGCTTDEGIYSAALGRAAKIDHLAKFDVKTLIERGKKNPPESIRGCVDTRSLTGILASTDPDEPIKLFALPKGWYAQEPRFVPHQRSESEDDGWLLTYVFDESQLDFRGACPDNARSELWIIDARNMKDIVARIKLPQRVPYGLHGAWFSEEEVQGQIPWERLRGEEDTARREVGGFWGAVRDACANVCAVMVMVPIDQNLRISG